MTTILAYIGGIMVGFLSPYRFARKTKAERVANALESQGDLQRAMFARLMAWGYPTELIVKSMPDRLQKEFTDYVKNLEGENNA